MITVFSAPLVLPVTAPGVLDGAVAVEDGRIAHVGTRAWVVGALARAGVDFVEQRWRGILTPGLVNAHTHLQYTNMAPVGQRTYPDFQHWSDAFDAVYAGDSTASALNWHDAAAAGAQILLDTGQTAAADIATDAEASSALHDAGLHGVTYWEIIGWTNADWQRGGPQTIERQLDRIPSPPEVGLSPHAPYSLDVEPLLDIPDLVRRRGLRLHLHLGEAEMEGGFSHLGESEAGQTSTAVEARLADHWRLTHPASFRALRAGGFGASATEFVDALGILGPDCHIAHGVYMTQRDRRLLRERGTAVALCPRSNAVTGIAEAPIAAYLAEGNPLAVGTDSLSSSPSLDLLEDVALVAEIAERQGYRDADLDERLLTIATLGGARALGLDVGSERIGQLQVGAVADIAGFDLPVGGVATGARDGVHAGIRELVRGGAGSCGLTIVGGEIRRGADALE